jgi:uncharacterized protein YfaT (DUF1175 family)
MLFVKILFSLILLPTFSNTQIEKNQLSNIDKKSFRAWIVTIVEDQIANGANPRWHQKDCAGLLRFAVNESLAVHDNKWRKSNGFINKPLPAEIEIPLETKSQFKLWKTSENDVSNFARALPLVQRNTEFIGKTLEYAEPGDILFFDQGDEQHLMIWTGRRIVYHNGHIPRKGEKSFDNGLRAVTFQQLMKWPDSQWRPSLDNPNFIGLFRLSFLINSKNIK